MKDMVDSIKAVLYERSVSPLSGAFISAWLVWNYHVPMILLSSESLEDKFEMLDKHFLPYRFMFWESGPAIPGWLVDNFSMPALLTLFYIFIYPALAKPVYKFSLRRQRDLREIKQKQNDNRLLSLEESRRIIRQSMRAEEEYENEISRLREKISALKEENEELTKLSRQQGNVESYVMPDEFEDMDDSNLGGRFSDAVRDIPKDEFTLDDVFEVLGWDSIAEEKKEALSERISHIVSRGDIPSVGLLKDGSWDKQVYNKEQSSQVTSIDQRAANSIGGLELEILKSIRDGVGVISLNHVANHTGLNLGKVNRMLEGLRDRRLVSYVNIRGSADKTFALTERGEEVLKAEEQEA